MNYEELVQQGQAPCSLSRGVTQGKRWKELRTQTGACLIWPSSAFLSPFLFTCLKGLKGALCVLIYEKGGRESGKGGSASFLSSSLKDIKTFRAGLTI